MSAEYPYDAVKSILLAGASSTKAQGEILVTWDIISPYFVSAANSLSIDIATSVPRGTFLCNWNFTQREAAVVINTIKELKCTCFFIVPIPSVYGFPENIQETMDEIISDGLDKIRLSCMTGDRNFLRDAVLPPYFAVHTTSKNMECVQRPRRCRWRRG